MATIWRVVMSVAIVYVILIATLYLFQRNIVFAPSTQKLTPGEVGLTDTAVVELPNADGEPLYNWHIPPAPGKPTLLYFHGNGGAIHGRASKLRAYQALGFGVFIVGYPGYGGSSGQPTEAALISAALNAYDYLAPQVQAERLVLYGESLGSAVATQVAAQRPVRALILAAPMYAIEEIAAQQYPFVPARLLIKDKFRSYEHIEHIDAPLLVVHGSEDGLIPIESGQALYERARPPKQFVRLDGAGHNNLYEFAILDAVEAFLQGLPPAVSP